MNERDLSNKPRSIWEASKHLLSSGAKWANENKETIMAGVHMAANLLAAKKEFQLEVGIIEPPKVKQIETLPVADYLNLLENLERAVLDI